MALCAQLANLWRRASVDVHLPLERPQRREAVAATMRRIEPHPRQPIAAIDVTGTSFAENAPAIIDHGLRDRSKRDAPESLNRKQYRQQKRDNVQAQRACGRAGARDGGEGL